jgi:hypothetical protein
LCGVGRISCAYVLLCITCVSGDVWRILRTTASAWEKKPTAKKDPLHHS